MNSRPTSHKEIRLRLSKLTTPDICDAYPGVRKMDPKIKPKNKHSQCIGRAYTVDANQDSLSTMLALCDLAPFLKFLNCQDDMVPIILIIATGLTPIDPQLALAGGICATTAEYAGFGGVLIDGPCRDLEEIEESGIPFFAKGNCPNSGSKNKLGSTKNPINCGGVKINPGDIIFGDRNGVVVMDEEEAKEAIPKAEEVKITGVKFFQRLKEGKSFNEITNIDKHAQNIEMKIPSKFMAKL
jgi:3-hexulose-6-phosphate synthase/6-phospho-3-hexuloisomerase